MGWGELVPQTLVSFPDPSRAHARERGLVYIEAFLGPNTFASLKSGSPIRLPDFQSTCTRFQMCIACQFVKMKSEPKV